METIETIVIVAQVRTMADGGLRFVFDAAESETLVAAQLMECKRFGVALKLIAEPAESKTKDDSRTIKRTKAKQRIKKSDVGV